MKFKINGAKLTKESLDNLSLNDVYTPSRFNSIKEEIEFMKMKKIVTHGGTHHADEILGIATIHEFVDPNLPIERTFKPSNEDLNDDQVFVLDIAKRFEPSLNNFDHHQNGSIPATNILVLDHVCNDDRLKDILKHHLYNYVDAVDRGHIIEGKEPNFRTPSLNAIIRNLNSVANGFDIALQVAKTALKGAIATAKAQIKGEDIWQGLEKKNKIAYNHTTEFVVGWKDLAEKENILLMISPNQRGGYQIVVRDSKVLTIPKDERQTFIHANQFLAVYKTFEDAESHANFIIDDYFLAQKKEQKNKKIVEEMLRKRAIQEEARRKLIGKEIYVSGFSDEMSSLKNEKPYVDLVFPFSAVVINRNDRAFIETTEGTLGLNAFIYTVL